EEIAAERLGVFEAEVFAAAETRAGFRDIFAEPVAGGDLGHAGEAQGRKEFGEAVEVLLAAAFGSVRRSVGIAAEAAVLRSRRKWRCSSVSELVRFVFDLGLCAGKAERINRGVGVAELVERFGEVDVAALVEGFAEQEDGAAILRRLLAQEVGGEGHGIEDGGAVVAGLDAVELGGDLAQVGGEAVEQFGLTVEVDDGDMVRDVTDDSVEERAEIAVVGQMADAVAADLDDND